MLAHISIHYFIILYRYCVSHKLKVCGKSVGTTFPIICIHFLFLCDILVILTVFPGFFFFSLFLYLLGVLWSVIFDVTIEKRLWLAEGSDDGSHFFLFVIFRAHLWHMEVSRVGVKSELPAYARAATMQDLSHVCDLYHSSCNLNPLRKARDWACVLMDTSQIRFRSATMGTLVSIFEQ